MFGQSKELRVLLINPEQLSQIFGPQSLASEIRYHEHQEINGLALCLSAEPIARLLIEAIGAAINIERIGLCGDYRAQSRA
jgi:hypothetical protein